MTRTSTVAALVLRATLGIAIWVGAPHAATAQEICGLASVQYNLMHGDGFESASGSSAASVASDAAGDGAAPDAKTKVPARTAFDLGKPLGYAPKIVQGVAPTLTIVSPSDGATLPGRRSRSPAPPGGCP